MISTELDGPVLVCTIDRPERRNALDADHLAGLRAAFAEAAAGASDASVRALVLTGAGDAFCAGADLTQVENRSAAAEVRAALDDLAALPIVTIAAVAGPAMGAGMQLALACDVRMVGERARFGVPSAKLGLMVDHWTIEKLALGVGHGFARSILLAADTIDADQAAAVGFAQRRGDLADAVSWGHEIAALAPLSIAGQKAALDAMVRFGTASAEVEKAFGRVWTSDDRLEGIAAFGEKRRPNFLGR